MIYLTVKNWAEFQHYKDRNPPWIKLHRTLLDDYEFACLQDASKLHLMLLWLLASQSEGRIPNDPKFLQGKLGLKSAPDLKPLIDHGFLIPEQSASNTLALGDSKLRLETEAYKEETYKEESTPPAAAPAPKKSRKTPLPGDFSVSPRVSAWAAEKGYDRLPEHLDAFKRKAEMNAYRYADWDMALMEAIREDWAKLRGNGRAGAPVAAAVPDGSIVCESCGTRTRRYTGRKCDPCWRGVVNPERAAA